MSMAVEKYHKIRVFMSPQQCGFIRSNFSKVVGAEAKQQMIKTKRMEGKKMKMQRTCYPFKNFVKDKD